MIKEKIVIEEEQYVKHFKEREKDFDKEQLCSGGNPEEWWHYKVEQVPETWEDLISICEKLKQVTVAPEKDSFFIDNIYFDVCGEILCKDRYSILSKHRTPAQMYGIVKNLI